MAISASYTEMNAAAVNMRKAAGEYQSGIDSLYTKVDSLSEVWKGQDNLEYIEIANSYKENLKSLGDAISQYADFLEKAASYLSETQDEVQADAGRL